jgi:hypothetical protein
METDSRESSDTEEGDRQGADEGSREDQDMGEGEDVDEQGKRELLYKSSVDYGTYGGF